MTRCQVTFSLGRSRIMDRLVLLHGHYKGSKFRGCPEWRRRRVYVVLSPRCSSNAGKPGGDVKRVDGQ